MPSEYNVLMDYGHIPEEVFNYAVDQAMDRAGDMDAEFLEGIVVNYKNGVIMFPDRRGIDQFEMIIAEKIRDMNWEWKQGYRAGYPDVDYSGHEFLPPDVDEIYTGGRKTMTYGRQMGRGAFELWELDGMVYEVERDYKDGHSAIVDFWVKGEKGGVPRRRRTAQGAMGQASSRLSIRYSSERGGYVSDGGRRTSSPSRPKGGGSPDYIGDVEEGALTKYGYHMRDRKGKRHRALRKAVRAEGYGTIMRRVNALYVWNKRDDPDLARIAQSDKKYLKKKFGS